MIKAVIFDLDGTLLDTLDDIVDSVNLTLSQYHFDCVNKLMVKEAIGNGVNRLISDLTNVTGIKLDELVNKQNENYYKLFNHKTKPFVGINDLLTELQNQKIFLFVNSNKIEELCIKLMDIHFKDINFSKIIGDSKNNLKKPDPTSVNKIKDEYKLQDDEILIVGDSYQDILAGINANVTTIGVLWGYRNSLVLKDANYLVKEPNQIMEIINLINNPNK